MVWGILWGQHRNSENIAIGVKKFLVKDLKKVIPFIEFEQYLIEDYIEKLYRIDEATKKGQKFDLQAARKTVTEYEKAIKKQYGPNLFNLHDGQQVNTDSDIEFVIPRDVEVEKLIQTISEVNKQHKLKIKTEILKSKGPFTLIDPNFITVEFMTPKPKRLKQFRNPKDADLVQKYDKDAMSTDSIYRYQESNTKDPLYQTTVQRYTAFMIDLLKELIKD